MTSSTSPSFNLASGSLLLLLAAVWGGTFFFAEIALEELPPLTIALFRVALAVPCLSIVIWMRGLRIPFCLSVWGAYLMMGALNNAIPFSLIFWGQTQITGGLASILNATTAMFAAVVAGLILKDEPLTLNKTLGAALGLGGVIFIIGPSALSDLDLASLAQLAVLAATVSYAFAGVWGRVALSGHPPLVNAFGMLVGSTILMIPVVLLFEGIPASDISLPVWSSLIAMATLSTALAYLLYFSILAMAGAANLLLVTLLIPAFAIGLGVAFLNEQMAPSAWIGFAVIAFGFAVTDGRLFRKRSSQI
ncbi:DMT family transporter [Marivita sp.]|uniref:DMT family transporter n=1 Tax=Marivita sp. TaxID=2003365 RepID=UPI00321B8EAB